MKSIFIILLSIVTLFAQSNYEQSFNLKDGTVINGTVLEETDLTFSVQTTFGVVTINKNELVETQYEVTLNTGEKLIGIKTGENDESIILKTQLGDLTIPRSNIKNIQEAGKVAADESKSEKSRNQYRRPYSLADFLFSGRKIDRDTDFALGEEQLIDLFFDPTGYTLDAGTMYLSGLSFGFGVSDKLQITTKWGAFFWGDMNLRPKLQIFEKGNWEKQSTLSVGLHYHQRWWPSNKYEWKSGNVNTDGGIKYWGGYYPINENPEYESNIFINYMGEEEEQLYRIDEHGEDSVSPMMEIFGAYTTSKAREGLRGRISHTIGGNIKFATGNDDPMTLLRLYYGLDVDINSKIKMVGEIFYDPSYLEMWQEMEYGDYNDSINDLTTTPTKKPSDVSPVHLDFGFIYALNETFRFGIHFQRPFLAFYWKL